MSTEPTLESMRRDMFISLTDILNTLFSKHKEHIQEQLTAIKKVVDGNAAALTSLSAKLAAISTDLDSIKIFIGMDGPPGTVTDGQVNETLAKVAAIRTQVGTFNP